ncbi:MAG: ComEC/Rec2 family competence protein [bacterium]
MGARTAIVPASAFWLGLVLADGSGSAFAWGSFAWGALVWGALACVLLALVGLGATARAGVRAVLVACACLALGAARAAVDGAHWRAIEAARPVLPALVRLEGVVDEPPRRAGEVPVVTLCVHAASPRWPRGARVTLRLPVGCTAEWGDTLEVLTLLAALPARTVPGGPDARAAGRAQARSASGRALVVRVRPARGGAWGERLAMRARRALEGGLAGLTPATRALAEPLLFGDRGGMDPDTDATLRASGLVHLLALSGLHVTWLAGAVRVVASWTGAGLAARTWAGALAAAAYLVLAGPIPSLARAVAAEAVMALALARGRPLDAMQALALAAFALLAWRPAWAGDLGFQLSCAATAGLVAVGGPLANWAVGWRGRGGGGRFSRVVRAVVGRLLEWTAPTLGAQCVALPLLLARFHALPWTSLAGNLVAVPLSEGLLAAASIGAACEAVLPGSGRVWLSAAEGTGGALRALTAALGGFPGALLPAGHSPLPVALATIAAVCACACAGPPRALDDRGRVGPVRRMGRVVALTASLAVLVHVLVAPPLRPPRGTWWFVALDVGQGDALAIAGDDGWWLVDAGPRSARRDAGEWVVLPFLRWAGVRRLEGVVLTHDDGDHTGGALAVRRGVPVRRWYAAVPRPAVPGPSERFEAQGLARGDSLALAPGARVLWPPAPGGDSGALADRGDNAASLVLELGTGAGRALLVADADSLVEEAIAVRPGVALLKAGHHGSASSSGARFVARLRAATAVVSCGAHNPYGHPDPRVSARLAGAGTAVARTDREGTLWWECDTRGARRIMCR